MFSNATLLLDIVKTIATPMEGQLRWAWGPSLYL